MGLVYFLDRNVGFYIFQRQTKTKSRSNNKTVSQYNSRFHKNHREFVLSGRRSQQHEYLIDTHKLDDDFIKKLQHKSGKKLDDIQNVVSLINAYRKNNYISIEDDLLKINNAIEKVMN